MNDHYDDYVAEEFATYCPDCEAHFMAGEVGFEREECFECGEANCYEIPA